MGIEGSTPSTGIFAEKTYTIVEGVLHFLLYFFLVKLGNHPRYYETTKPHGRAPLRDKSSTLHEGRGGNEVAPRVVP